MGNEALITARTVNVHEICNLLINNGYCLVKMPEDWTMQLAGDDSSEIQVKVDEESVKSMKEEKRRIQMMKLEQEARDFSPSLLKSLRTWRMQKAQEAHLPVYCIIPNKTLFGIVINSPASMDDLMSIPGVGNILAEKYGAEILEIVRRDLEELPPPPFSLPSDEFDSSPDL